MRKTLTFKVAFIGILLIGCGFIAAFVFDANPLARAKPENRSLDQLLVDMGVEIFPNSTSQVEVQLHRPRGHIGDVDIARGGISFDPLCGIGESDKERILRPGVGSEEHEHHSQLVSVERE